MSDLDLLLGRLTVLDQMLASTYSSTFDIYSTANFNVMSFPYDYSSAMGTDKCDFTVISFGSELLRTADICSNLNIAGLA